MFDTTPGPLGDVTRRWTHLDDTTRAYHVDRLLGHECLGHGMAHVGSPKADEGACYRRLVLAAVDGDPVGLGWIATTHRPLLVSHGRALLERDPALSSDRGKALRLLMWLMSQDESIRLIGIG